MTDPLLLRCANCGETWEAHQECDCKPFCDVRLCPDGTGTWREETREDRMADSAAARGI